MQYHEELQPSFSEEEGEGINIDSIVPYLDNPPQFDLITNKVQSFGHKSSKKSYVICICIVCSDYCARINDIKYV